MTLMRLMTTMSTEPAPQQDSTGYSELRGPILLKFVGGSIFKSTERLVDIGELRTRAEQLGATVVYEHERESGYLQASSYLIARFHLADPTGW